MSIITATNGAGRLWVEGTPGLNREWDGLRPQAHATENAASDATAAPLDQDNDRELIAALGMDEAVKKYAMPQRLPPYNTSAILASGPGVSLLGQNGLYGAGETVVKSRYPGLDRLSEPEQQRFNRQVMGYYYSALEERGVSSVGQYLDFINTPGSRLHQQIESRLNQLIDEDHWMSSMIRAGRASMAGSA